MEDIGSSTLIEFMESNFDLVIVPTYFDHGLCYLRQKLCWTYDDIVYLEQNQRSEKGVYTAEQKKMLHKIIREVIPVYVHAFQYFEKKFKEKIKNPKFDSEVQTLKKLIGTKRKKCVQPGKMANSNDERLVPSYQPVPINSYSLKNNSTECVLLAMPEKSKLECLRKKEQNRKRSEFSDRR